jgi:hypothetical protein
MGTCLGDKPVRISVLVGYPWLVNPASMLNNWPLLAFRPLRKQAKAFLQLFTHPF